MDNVKLEVKNDKLTIEIDLKKDYGFSKSGKTIVVASTRGNATVPEHPEMKLGINCYKFSS